MIPNIEHLETEKSKSRWFPELSYTNFKSKASATCFNRWFSVNRYWGGKLIKILIRHHELTLDFRKNPIADIIP